MLSQIFNLFANLFSSSDQEYKKDCRLLDNAINNNCIDSWNQINQKLQKHNPKIYEWLKNAKPYVSQNKLNEVSKLAFSKYIYEDFIQWKRTHPAITNSDVDQEILLIEKNKLEELKEISWRQALKD